METTVSKKREDMVAFSTAESYTVVAMGDIVCCMAEGGYTRIFMEGRPDGLLIAKGLIKLEAFLPSEQFVRVHNNAIVNLGHIRTMQKGEDKAVVLSNGARVEVADRRWKELMGRLRIF